METPVLRFALLPYYRWIKKFCSAYSSNFLTYIIFKYTINKFYPNSTEQPGLNHIDLCNNSFQSFKRSTSGIPNKTSKFRGICSPFSPSVSLYLRIITLFSIMGIKLSFVLLQLTPKFSILDCPYCLWNTPVSFPYRWWESRDKKHPFDIYPIQLFSFSTCNRWIKFTRLYFLSPLAGTIFPS